MTRRFRTLPGLGLMRALAGAVAFALAFAGASAANAQSESGLAVGTKAPVVKVNDLDGKPVDLGQWVGRKPVFLEFWATWCENCEALLPRIKAAHQAHGKGVEFIAVNVTVNQNPERVRRYIGEHGIDYRVLYDDQATSVRAYQAPATSYIVILDRTGKVAYSGVGADQRFEAALARVAGG
jgi:thiol-disulfide isomerase/thioredoxin